MSRRPEIAVTVGDEIRTWGSAGEFRRVLGVRRAAGITRFYLDGLTTPLEVGAGADVDARAVGTP